MLSRTAVTAAAVSRVSARAMASAATWAHVEPAPADPIMGLTAAYNVDDAPMKVNVGVGAYRDDSGKPWVLPSVRAATDALHLGDMNHEYAGISGVPGFVAAARKMAVGDARPSETVASSQTVSGTGALRIAGEFLARHYEPFVEGRVERAIYLPDPSWGNHNPIFKDSGLNVLKYRYFDHAAGRGINWDGLVADIAAAPEQSVILLHACAHNPTGVDPTAEQWAELSALMAKKGHLPFFDMAYQGFASGDPDKDVAAVRKFMDDGHRVVLSQSFAKNFGLYGERAGAIHVMCNTEAEAKAVDSRVKQVIRPMYSNPPVFGAKVVEHILNDTKLTAQWHTDIRTMSDRILEMRASLRAAVEGAGSTRDWSNLTDTIGMFCYTGLTVEQVAGLRQRHIYCTNDGRISVAGVTSGNVEYIGQAIHEVTK